MIGEKPFTAVNLNSTTRKISATQSCSNAISNGVFSNQQYKHIFNEEHCGQQTWEKSLRSNTLRRISERKTTGHYLPRQQKMFWHSIVQKTDLWEDDYHLLKSIMFSFPTEKHFTWLQKKEIFFKKSRRSPTNPTWQKGVSRDWWPAYCSSGEDICSKRNWKEDYLGCNTHNSVKKNFKKEFVYETRWNKVY